MIFAMEYPLVLLGQLSWLCPFSISCIPPAQSLRQQSRTKGKPCPSAQQQPNWCVTSTAPVTDQNTAPSELLGRKWTLSQANPVHLQTAQKGPRSLSSILLFREVAILGYSLGMFAGTAHWCCHCVKEKHENCQGLINWRIFINQKCILENSQWSEWSQT